MKEARGYIMCYLATEARPTLTRAIYDVSEPEIVACQTLFYAAVFISATRYVLSRLATNNGPEVLRRSRVDNDGAYRSFTYCKLVRCSACTVVQQLIRCQLTCRYTGCANKKTIP